MEEEDGKSSLVLVLVVVVVVAKEEGEDDDDGGDSWLLWPLLNADAARTFRGWNDDSRRSSDSADVGGAITNAHAGNMMLISPFLSKRPETRKRQEMAAAAILFRRDNINIIMVVMGGWCQCRCCFDC